MLNISGINNGVVLDHIQAGKSMDIYHYLNLQELDCQVAIIKNAKSSKMGRKDIIKIEGSLDLLDLDALGYIDHKITVNIIKDGVISEKGFHINSNFNNSTLFRSIQDLPSVHLSEQPQSHEAPVPSRHKDQNIPTQTLQ